MVYKLFFIFMFVVCSNLVAKEFDEIKTFEANFTQIIVNNSNKKIEYHGKIYIKDNSKIVWKYKSPIIKNVYIDKNFAIIDEPELEQAIFTSLNKEINIVKLLKDAKKIEENVYETSMYDTSYKITMQNRRIKSIKYKDEIENSIEIIFSNIKQNQKLDESIFKFQPPKGYDIIRK